MEIHPCEQGVSCASKWGWGYFISVLRYRLKLLRVETTGILHGNFYHVITGLADRHPGHRNRQWKLSSPWSPSADSFRARMLPASGKVDGIIMDLWRLHLTARPNGNKSHHTPMLLCHICSYSLTFLLAPAMMRPFSPLVFSDLVIFTYIFSRDYFYLLGPLLDAILIWALLNNQGVPLLPVHDQTP